MGIKKYKYSSVQTLVDIMVLSFATLLSFMALIDPNSSHESMLFFGVLLIMSLGRFVYLGIMYFIPCFQGKTALELDKDKLQLFIKGKLLFQVLRDVAYWNDIEDIEFTAPAKGSAIISFKMKDRSVFGFRTKYIAGNNKDIYNTIMEYFNNRER